MKTTSLSALGCSSVRAAVCIGWARRLTSAEEPIIEVGKSGAITPIVVVWLPPPPGKIVLLRKGGDFNRWCSIALGICRKDCVAGMFAEDFTIGAFTGLRATIGTSAIGFAIAAGAATLGKGTLDCTFFIVGAAERGCGGGSGRRGVAAVP